MVKIHGGVVLFIIGIAAAILSGGKLPMVAMGCVISTLGLLAINHVPQMEATA